MKALGDTMLVDPYYDSDKIGSLYLPDTAKNPEPQQGVVLAGGPYCGVQDGTYIVFHPYRGETIRIEGKDLITLRKLDVVGIVEDDKLYPTVDHLMLLPNWECKYQQPSSLIYSPPIVTEQNQPTLTATILKIGPMVDTEVEYPELAIGKEVVIQPAKGSEIGWMDTVYYFLRPSHILACLK